MSVEFKREDCIVFIRLLKTDFFVCGFRALFVMVSEPLNLDTVEWSSECDLERACGLRKADNRMWNLGKNISELIRLVEREPGKKET